MVWELGKAVSLLRLRILLPLPVERLQPVQQLLELAVDDGVVLPVGEVEEP